MKNYLFLLFCALTLSLIVGCADNNIPNWERTEELTLVDEGLPSGEVVVSLPKRSKGIDATLSSQELTTDYIIWVYTDTDKERYKWVSCETEQIKIKAPVGEVTIAVYAVGRTTIKKSWTHSQYASVAVSGMRTIYGFGKDTCIIEADTTNTMSISLRSVDVTFSLPESSFPTEKKEGNARYSLNVPYLLAADHFNVYFRYVDDEGNVWDTYSGSARIPKLTSDDGENYTYTTNSMYGPTFYNKDSTSTDRIPTGKYYMEGFVKVTCFGEDFYLMNHGGAWIESGWCQIGVPLGSVSASIEWI